MEVSQSQSGVHTKKKTTQPLRSTELDDDDDDEDSTASEENNLEDWIEHGKRTTEEADEQMLTYNITSWV